MNRMTAPSNNILTGQTERIASVAPSVAVRVGSKLLVMLTFLLLIAGALVTSNKAALADPNWPTSIGGGAPKYWVGNLFYVNLLRYSAVAVGFATLALALLIQLKEHRRFVKYTAWGAVAVIALEMYTGGQVVRHYSGPFISVLHSVIAHVFFCLTIALVVFTSRTWFLDQARPLVMRRENRGFITFLKVASIVLFFQVVLGGGVRHSNDSADMFLPFLMAHIFGAMCVIIMVTWLNLRTFQVYKEVTPLRRAAITAAALLVYQITFGVLAIFANRARLQTGLPEPHHVFTSTSHMLGGTCLLALFFGTFLRARHMLDRTTFSEIPGQAYQSHEVNA